MTASWRLPPDLVSGSGRARRWAIENLSVAQLLVTTQSASTGRTDQAFAENVSIEGQRLIGPWRVEGTTSGVPFRLVTGELAEDKTIQVKLSGGGDIYPRFDLDARLGLNEGMGDAATPNVSGKAKVLFGPPAQIAAAGIPIPIAVETEFKTVPGAVELNPVSLEAGEGGASLRMTGEGRIGLNEPRISLKLEGRRLDADSFILSGERTGFQKPAAAMVAAGGPYPHRSRSQDRQHRAGPGGPVERQSARCPSTPGAARLDRIEFTAPGETRVALEGQLGLTTRGGINGKVALASNASDRLARYLARIGINSPLLRVLDGRPVEASSEIAFSNPVLSFNRLRLKTGESTLTGNVRYTAPEADERGKVEAQVAIQSLNLDDLPQLSSVFQATEKVDVGFILDARGVSAGKSPPTGRISARILSDGPALLVETLDIVDLAGANARVRGRIAPDGSGQITGKVTAQRADPLVDLLGSVWVGGISKLVPHFVREGALDLDVTSERVAPVPGSTELRLRTTAKGRVAGGPFEGRVESVDGRTESLTIGLSTDSTGRWVNRANLAGLNRPSQIDLRGTRVGSGQFNLTIAGDVAGVRIATRRPFSLSEGDDVVDSGEAEISTADIAPFLQLLGDGAGVASPVPANGRVTLGRERGATLLDITGKVANNNVQARLVAASRSEIGGEVSLERVSLPWLVAALSLNMPGDAGATAIWSTARFGQSGRLITGGQVTFRVGSVELGRGLQASRASFVVEAKSDGISLRNFDATLGSGRITGGATITRQGAVATIVGEGSLERVPLWTLAGSTPFEAVLSGPLKFGAVGSSPAELVANLGGAGDWQVTNLRIPAADPGRLRARPQAGTGGERPAGRGQVGSDPRHGARSRAVQCCTDQDLGGARRRHSAPLALRGRKRRCHLAGGRHLRSEDPAARRPRGADRQDVAAGMGRRAAIGRPELAGLIDRARAPDRCRSLPQRACRHRAQAGAREDRGLRTGRRRAPAPDRCAARGGTAAGQGRRGRGDAPGQGAGGSRAGPPRCRAAAIGAAEPA